MNNINYNTILIISRSPTHYLKQIIQDTLDFPGVFEIAVTQTTCRLMQIELNKRGELS